MQPVDQKTIDAIHSVAYAKLAVLFGRLVEQQAAITELDPSQVAYIGSQSLISCGVAEAVQDLPETVTQDLYDRINHLITETLALHGAVNPLTCRPFPRPRSAGGKPRRRRRKYRDNRHAAELAQEVAGIVNAIDAELSDYVVERIRREAFETHAAVHDLREIMSCNDIDLLLSHMFVAYGVSLQAQVSQQSPLAIVPVMSKILRLLRTI